jgi:Na+-transporting NADH:ubiquinone oxidoreductase subunit NqrB
MDYLFIGIVTFIVMTLIFFILGMTDLEFPKPIIYHTLSLVFSFPTALLFIAADFTWGPVLQWAFYLFGALNFVLVVLHGVSAFKSRQEERWEI